MKTSKYIVLDVETGGLKPAENPITQLALVVLDSPDLSVLLEYENYVKPYSNLVITQQAIDATMVKRSDILNGISASELVKDLIEVFKQFNPSSKAITRPILVGHNIAFDIGFLDTLFKIHKKNIFDFIQGNSIDTLALAKMAWHGKKHETEGDSLKLTSCLKWIGKDLVDAHGAMNDVRATADLFSFFQNKLRTEGVMQVSSGKTNSKKRDFFDL
jgi:DNA polymerase III alpha subunit (gram-positive type)